MGFVVRSKRISHPCKITVESLGADLGARMTLLEWSWEASRTGLHGALPFWDQPYWALHWKEGNNGYFNRADSKEKHSERVRALQRAWDTLGLQWPQQTFTWQIVGCIWQFLHMIKDLFSLLGPSNPMSRADSPVLIELGGEALQLPLPRVFSPLCSGCSERSCMITIPFALVSQVHRSHIAL